MSHISEVHVRPTRRKQNFRFILSHNRPFYSSIWEHPIILEMSKWWNYLFIKDNLVKSTVEKDIDMEIGYPTEVKHVAHVGWEGSSGSAPAWVKLSLSLSFCLVFICFYFYFCLRKIIRVFFSLVFY